MTIFGYARALPGQDDILSDQLTSLVKFGKAERIFQESVSLYQVKRDVFFECTSSLVAGDELVVTNLSVLGMRHFELLSFLPELRDRGINFRSINDQFTTKFEMDSYQVLDALARCEYCLKIERRLIDQMQKKRGPDQKLGDEELNRAREMRADGQSLGNIASALKVSKATLSRRM